MSTPRWLRERRRLLKECERYPMRYVFMPAPNPPAITEAEIARRIWTTGPLQ